MTILLTLCVAALSLLVQPTQPADTGDALKQRILERAGIRVWPEVKRLTFTFNVESDGKQVASVTHDWDLLTGIDTVTTGGKSVAVKVYGFDSEKASDDEKQAFSRWTNDSYWLLMPLKLNDGGVTVKHEGEQQVAGKPYQTLRLSFANVGLTPGDQYLLYVDDAGLVRYWDYMPSPQRTARFTWGGYQDFNGLTLATEHETVGEGPKRRIYFTDVQVERR